jgi:glucuronokinase
VHSNVKARFQNGDSTVIEAMKSFGRFALEARDVILSKDYDRLAQLFKLNYECRRELYGDEVIGRNTMRMIEIANAQGHAAKLSGSGGCVVGMPFHQKTVTERGLKLEMERGGFTFVWLDV